MKNEKYISERDRLIDQGYNRQQAMSEARKKAFNETQEQHLQSDEKEQVQDIQDT